jgi:hypothetical protein
VCCCIGWLLLKRRRCDESIESESDEEVVDVDEGVGERGICM